MHIIVCMKQVPDLEKIRIKADTREPVLEGVPLRFGDFDKNALEEAVRIKEKLGDAKVTVVSIGTTRLKDGIKETLAIGADEAVILTHPLFEGSDATGTACVLARVIQKLGACDLIMLGEGSTDDHTGQVPPRLAELLGLPAVTYVREVSLQGQGLRATRDLEDALTVVECPLPAIVSVTGEINTPRLPPLTAILKAARKPTRTWEPADIGITSADAGAQASMIRTLGNLAPAKQRKAIIFEGAPNEAVDELLRALEREGVL